MSKRKSFTSDALSTLTGGSDLKQKKANTGDNSGATAKNSPVGEKSKKVTQGAKKAASAPKMAQTITARSPERTGKPVTLYLNTENYAAFKVKAKEDKRTASNLINEFIAGYISE